ncbi:MAG: hypothetical protein WAM14_21795 [Candidatus Nitrosopolaris sp.]
MVYHDQEDVPYDGFADVGGQGLKHIVHLDIGVIDPDHPLQPSPHEKHAGLGED